MIKKIIYSFLFLISCIGAYMLGFYLFKPDKVILDDVSLRELAETSKGSNMAIMIGDKEGNYSNYEETGFPNNKLYRFNNEKSGCVDASGNTVANVLSYNDTLSKVSLRTTQSVSCYLYFDFIPEPTVTVTLNEEDALNVTATIISDKDGTYCINKSSDSNTSCLVSGSVLANESVTTDRFAVSGTYYVHVEDEVEQVGHSSAVNVNIIYNQIEYIEGTGTQYINTGYIPNQDSRIILDFENTYTGTVNLALCGARISTTNSVFGIWIRGQNLVYPHYGNTSYSTITVNINTAQRLIYDMNSNQSKVGDINNTATAATFSSTYPLTIFAMNSGGTIDNSRVSVGKLYSTKLYDSGTMVRDLYPVVRISDNEVGLYDKVNKVFYTNAGTGSFVAGDVIETEGIGASSKVVINNGATYSTSRTVTLDIYSSNASTMCISESETCTNYVAYSTSGSYAFSSDGEKVLYVTFKGSTGNIIETVNDSITIDTVAPSGGSISINGGNAYTNSTTVTLTLSSSGASHMCISNTTSCTNYVTYAQSYSWTLNNSTNGTKTVYVTFKDAAGNTSSRTSDTITLDTANPTVTVTNNESTLTISSNEAGTYCINTSSTATDMSNCTFSGSLSANSEITTSEFTTEGTYYVHVKDNAGNIGISSVQEIVLFDPVPFGEYLLDNALSGKTAYSGLYRYVGQNTYNSSIKNYEDNVNNYVNLGGVLYRIIGVTDGSTTNTSLGLSANQVKVMKAESIGTKQWYTDYKTDVRWNVSGYTATPIYTELQSNAVLGNSTVIPSTWTSKISSVKWYVGDVNTREIANGSTVFGYEDNATTQSNAKVGLIYMSDYYYSVNDGGTTDCLNTTCLSWMTYISSEWTMSRYGGGGSYYAWYVYGFGSVGNLSLDSAYAVRPVFYLDSSVLYTGTGDGTSGSPYQIA